MNFWDVILTVILVTIVVFALRHIRNDRKAGKFSCGGNCSSCMLLCSGNSRKANKNA